LQGLLVLVAGLPDYYGLALRSGKKSGQVHFQRNEVISGTAQRSARALIATAVAVIISIFYGISFEDLVILEVNIPAAAVESGALGIVVFLIVNHGFHWFGDYRSLEPWNSPETVNGLARNDQGALIQSKIGLALEQIGTFEERFEFEDLKGLLDHSTNVADDKTKDHIQDIRRFLNKFEKSEALGFLKEAKDSLENIRSSHAKVRSYAGFYLWIWHLAVPVGVGLFALVKLLMR
jgi:hypothetical protein